MANDDIVTDPKEVAAFEAAKRAHTPLPRDTQGGAGTPVTDPAEIAKFEQTKSITPGWDAVGSAVSGGMRGILTGVPGLPGDLAMLGALGLSKLPLIGNEDATKAIRADLAGTGDLNIGSAGIANLLHRIGVLPDYHPNTPTGQTIQNVAGVVAPMMTGNPARAVTTAAIRGPALLKATGMEAAQLAARDAGVGIGAAGGQQLARDYVAPTATKYLGPDWGPLLTEAAGTMLGAKVTGGAANRLTPLYEKNALVDMYEKAGVTPRFASDVNPSFLPPSQYLPPQVTPGLGLMGHLLSDWLPQRTGAQTISRNSAKMTQDELAQFGDRSLRTGYNKSSQEQGAAIQNAAQQSVKQLRQEITSAYDDLNNAIPGTTLVPTANTTAAIGNLVNQAVDPAVKAVVTSPMFQKYAGLLTKPQLQWSDMNVLRQEIGQSLQSVSGPDLGLLKQAYKGLADDMRGAAQSVPEGLNKFNLATRTASENNDKIRGVLDAINNKDLPETLPRFITQNAKDGGTRIKALLDTPGFDPALQGHVGQGILLGKSGGTNGPFDLTKLMEFWKGASPEMQAGLTRNPAILEAMGRLETMYDATTKSRALAGSPTRNPLLDPGEIATGGIGALGLTTPALHDFNLPSFAAAAAVGMPIGMAGLAGLTQRTGLVGRFGSPVEGEMLGSQSTVRLPAMTIPSSTFPDVFRPQGEPERHSALDLRTASPESGTAFIAQRLGPQVAQQIGAAGPAGYKSAVFALMSNPTSRQALAPDETEAG